MASTGVQMKSDNIQAVYIKPVPSFQALPSSITSAQFAQPTKVEYYPRDEDLPAIDLKGHSVEELAAMANVSVEVIKSAIKLRQQQLMMTKATTAASSAPPKALSKIVRTTRTTSSPPRSTIGDVTTQSPITLPSTTPFETKKKVTKKPVVRSGHKVSEFITIKREFESLFPRNRSWMHRRSTTRPATIKTLTTTLSRASIYRWHHSIAAIRSTFQASTRIRIWAAW